MRRSEILGEWARLQLEDGPWTAHNIEVAPGHWTLGHDEPMPDDLRLARLLALLEHELPRPLAGAWVLDLGCLEGLFAIELARRGARVLAVEARHRNARKTAFAARALGLRDVQVLRADVRALELVAGRPFDLVLCLGLLYHLEGQAALRLLERLRVQTRGIVIVDTHVATVAQERVELAGRELGGRPVREHRVGAQDAEIERATWASLGRAPSFWFDRDSLRRLFRVAGFRRVEEREPLEECPEGSRTTWLLAVESATGAVHPTDHAPGAWDHM